MAISALQAARTIAESSGWKLSNLQIQKIIYLAHMLFLGRYGRPLIDEYFEAWHYGPVIPALYHELKIYGNRPVKDIFKVKSADKDSLEGKLLISAVKKFQPLDPSYLVAYTHRENGAWSKNYDPDYRGVVIPDNEIKDEYFTLEGVKSKALENTIHA